MLTGKQLGWKRWRMSELWDLLPRLLNVTVSTCSCAADCEGEDKYLEKAKKTMQKWLFGRDSGLDPWPFFPLRVGEFTAQILTCK